MRKLPLNDGLDGGQQYTGLWLRRSKVCQVRRMRLANAAATKCWIMLPACQYELISSQEIQTAVRLHLPLYTLYKLIDSLAKFSLHLRVGRVGGGGGGRKTGGEGVRIGRGGGWLVVFVYVFPMDESDWLARGAYGDFYSNVGLDIRQARAKSTQHVWIDIY